jgi:hypothetical protein
MGQRNKWQITFFALMLATISSLNAQYKGKTFVITSSNHNWFNIGYKEHFQAEDLILEQLNIADKTDSTDYIYKANWTTTSKGVKLISLKMSPYADGLKFKWVDQSYKGIVVDDKTGFTIFFDNGKTVQFTELKHFIL